MSRYSEQSIFDMKCRVEVALEIFVHFRRSCGVCASIEMVNRELKELESML